MKFRALSETLRETANRAAQYFAEQRALKKIIAETAIESFPGYAFTLSGTTTDHQDVCMEVSEMPYPSILENVVLDCKSQSVPLALYSLFPERQSPPSNYKERVDRARMHGVGVIEITPTSIRVVHEATPLHLHGARLEIKKFPKRFRQSLIDAENVFRAGSPAKGCSIIYDEMEAQSRTLAERTYKQGLWKNSPENVQFRGVPWARVMDELHGQLDYKRCNVKKALVARILGITEHRNESGHKPKNKAARLKRDKELRTRFEAAADLLLELASIKP